MPHRAFVDTSAFYTLADSDSPRHAEARNMLDSFHSRRLRLYATTFVLAESYGLILLRLGRGAAQGYLNTTRASIELIRPAAEDERYAEDILLHYDDQDFSYVDALSFAVIDRLGIRRAFAFDAHFATFRPRRGQLLVNQ